MIYYVLLATLSLHLVTHEFGHALMAGLCGLRTERCVIGKGPRLLRLSVGRSNVDLHLLPFGGHVLLGLQDPDHPPPAIRSRLLLSYAAGPVSTLLVSVVGGPLALLFLALFGQHETAWATLFASTIETAGWTLFIMNMFPWPRSTDGAQMLTLARCDRSALQQRIDSLAVGPVYRLIAEGRHQDATEVFGREIQDPAARRARLTALTLSERYAEAFDGWFHLLHDDPAAQEDPLVLNNVAWAAANLGGADQLALADTCSLRSWELARHDPPIRPTVAGTRGRTLLELGRFADALPFLDEAVAVRGDALPLVLAARCRARLGVNDWFGAQRDAGRASQRQGNHPYVRGAVDAVNLAAVATVVQLAPTTEDRHRLKPVLAAARRALTATPEAAACQALEACPGTDPTRVLSDLYERLGLSFPEVVASN